VVVGRALRHHQHRREAVAAARRRGGHGGAAGRLELRLHAAGVLLGAGPGGLHALELRGDVGQLVAEGPAGRRRTGRARPAVLHPVVQGGVLLQQAGQLLLDLVQEGVDVLLVVSALAHRRLLEGHVVDVGWGEQDRAPSNGW
jgi:hypothetical protein